MQQERMPNDAESTLHHETRNIKAQEVESLVSQLPGHTSAELASKAGKDRAAMARRLPEAASHADRRVHKGQARACTVTGRRAITWWPVAVGLAT